MGTAKRSTNIFEQEFGEEKPNGKPVPKIKTVSQKQETPVLEGNIFAQQFGLKKKEESQESTQPPVQSSVGSGDGTLLTPQLQSSLKSGNPENDDRYNTIANSDARSLLENYKTTAKQKNDEVLSNIIANGRAYKDFSQSREGKVGQILTDVVEKGEVNASDINYLAKVAPKATKDLFSIVGKDAENVTTETVNEFIDTFREKVDQLSTAQKVANNQYINTNVKAKLSSEGIDPVKLNDDNYANSVSAGVIAKRDKELAEIERQYPVRKVQKNTGKFGYWENERKDEGVYKARVAAIEKKYAEANSQIGISKAFDFAKQNPSFSPLEIGEIYLKYADPDTYTLWVKNGKKGAIDRDIAEMGVRALYGTGNDGSVQLAKKDEINLDNQYPDKKKTEVLHRLGAELYKDENWFLNASPSVEMLDKAAEQLNEKDREFYYNHIREEERRNFGTNVPLSGGVNKLGEAIASSASETWKGLGDFIGVRSDKAQAKDALNESNDTRYQGVGTYGIGVQRLKEIDDKQKEGKPLSPQEIDEKQDLETFVGVRSTGQEIVDGTGNLTGQVIFQALATKGLGAVANAGLKGVGLAKTAQIAEGLAAEDAIASNAVNFGINKATAETISAMSIAYASSYDAAKRDAWRLMPDDKDAGKRRIYATIVGGLNAGTERIFKDEKILNAFNKEISPSIKTLVNKLASGEIEKEAFASSISQLLLKSKSFLKEAAISNTKEATEELATSVGQSVATSILAPAKFNEKQAYDDAVSTFTTTFLHGGLVAGLGGMQSFRANNIGIPTIAKLGIDQNLTENTKSFINAQVLSGNMTQDEANGKFKILNTAEKINRDVMPQVDAVSQLPQKAREKYAVQMLNENILRGQAKITEDTVLKSELENKANESEKIRKDILGRKLFVDDNYVVQTEDTINKEEVAEEETEVPVQNTDTLFNRVFEKKGAINNVLDESKKEESVSFLKEQSLTTPASLNNKLGDDEELTTDLIAQNTTEQIEEQITKLEDELNRDDISDQRIKEIDAHLPLLDKGLQKASGVSPTQRTKNKKEVATAAKVSPILERINNADYINEKELDAAADEMYSALDEVESSDNYTPEQKENARNLIEPVIQKIEGYEFRTKTEIGKTTETKATQVAKPTSVRKTETKPPLERVAGTKVSVKGQDGNTVSGTLNVRGGQYVVDVPGGTQRVIGEKAITDRDLTLPDIEEKPLAGDFDAEGNFSFTVKDRNGNLITITDPDIALDLAIQVRADAIGEVSMEEFDTIYETIEKEGEPREVLVNEGKEVPVKKENETKPKTDTESTKKTDKEHRDYIIKKFKNEFGKKGVPQEQLDVAVALMDARAKASGLGDAWYRQIEDVGNGDFQSADVKNQAQVYHGSPHVFDKFTTTKMGTGEGVQAFGWGLYFTELKDIAKNYAKVLGSGKFQTRNGEETLREIMLSDRLSIPAYDAILDVLSKQKEGYSKNDLLKALAERMTKKKTFFDKIFGRKIPEEAYREAYNYLSLNVSKVKPASKNLYDVTLYKGKSPSEYKWMIWDKNVEPDTLNKLSRNAGISLYGGGNQVYGQLSRHFKGDKNASLFLLANGIDGIKYPAEGLAKGKTSDTARGFNYVVFDSNAVTINDRVKLQGEKGALETLEDGKRIIHALNNPDFSTTVHEIAHIFEDELSVSDRNTVKEWAKTDDWNIETSEAFARGFERYLRDGNAPTPELKTIFQKAKEWLQTIYQKLVGSPIEKNISPEVKEVFDRLFIGESMAAKEKPKSKETKPPTRKELSEQLKNLLGGNTGLVSNEVADGISKELGIKEGDTIEQVIDKLIDYDGELTPVLNFLKELPDIGTVKFQKVSSIAGRQGEYVPESNKAELPENRRTVRLGETDNPYYAAVHEIMHFLTLDSDQVNKYADKQKLAALKTIYDFAANQKGTTANTMAQYGLTDFREFMVELAINPAFRQEIADVAASREDFKKAFDLNNPSPDNILTVIKDFIADLIQKIFQGSNYNDIIDHDKSLLDNAVALATEVFFAGNDVISYQQQGQSQAISPTSQTENAALPASSQVIADFVKNALEQGASVEDIKSALFDNGFTDEQANELLGKKTSPQTEKTEKEFENNKKAILSRISESKNIPNYVKERFAKEGLRYDPQSHVVAREMAKNIIKEFGVEDAITAAESGRFNGDVNSMIFAEGIDQTYQREQDATTIEGKQRIAEQWADYVIRYDQVARDKGRFISAVYEFYRRSPLGIIMAEKAQREETFNEWFKKKDKDYQEVFNAIKDEPEFKEFVKSQAESQTKAERAVTRMHRRKKISDIFDSAKLDTKGLNSFIIPPQIWNGAMEVMKQAALAGESLVDVINSGIQHIKSNHTEAFNEQELRNKWTSQFKGIDKQENGDKVLSAAKTRLRTQIDSLNDQIQKGARADVTKNEIEYDDEAKELLGERDRLKAILDEISPLEKNELTDEQRAKMAEGLLKRSIEEYERRIKEKDIAKKDKKEAKSPEIDRLKGIRDELKTEYDAMKKEMTRPSEEETSKKIKERVLNRFRKKLTGLSESQKEDVIRQSFKQIVENGGLEYDEFKKIIADVMGLGELSPEEASKINNYVQDLNKVQDAADRVLSERTSQSVNDFHATSKKAERAATELGNIRSSKANLTRRVSSIIQLNTLGLVSLIKNPIYNVAYQVLVRLPKGIVQTALDQTIYGVSVLANKAFNTPVVKPDVNILLAQGGYFSQGSKGASQSVQQVFTGLTNLDYFQKEIRTSQIKPLSSWNDLWQWKKGEKFLSSAQVADKLIQGTVGAPAEIVARLLNIGDKGFRYGAEGAIASTIASQEFGIKGGVEKEIFMTFPKEESLRRYKERGMEHEEATRRAEAIERRIVTEGESAVFQQENLLNNALTGISNGIRNFSEQYPDTKALTSVMSVLGTVNMPFIKTPANIAWDLLNLAVPEIAMVQSSLYGFAAGWHLAKGDSEKARGYYLKAKKWTSHAAVGYALVNMAGYLASIGAITGSDDEEKAKERKGKKTYQRPRSLNISKVMRAFSGDDTADQDGDLLMDLSWYGVVGTILNMQANRYENVSAEERENMSALADIFPRMKTVATEGLENSIFNNSIAGLNALKQGGRWVNSWATSQINVASNFFQPATLAQFGRSTLPYNPSIKADTFGEELKNNFATRSLLFRAFAGYPPSDITVWGDKSMKNNTGVKGVAFNMLGFDEVNKDIFAEPIYQDFKRTGNSSFFPPDVLPKLTVDGQDKKMNVEQERQFKTLVGQSRKALVEPYINGFARIESEDEEIDGMTYNELNDVQRVKALNVLYKNGYNAGKSQFKVLYPDFMSTKEKEKAEENE